MKNLPLLIVTVLGTLALVIGVAVAFSRSSTQVQTVDRALLEANPRLVKGPAEAKVTIVEFSDFQCPYCRELVPYINQVTAKYPNDVRVIYRHFPLVQLHPYANLAAQFAEVAVSENKFWEMHDRLYEQQTTWAKAPNEQAANDLFTSYAENLGIDKQIVTERIQSDSIKQAIAQDLSLGTQIGVDSTPSVYVNGQKLPAPQQLMSTVEELLK
jgi:protein-disulfide isomerase